MLLCCRPARDCIQKRSLAHAKRIRSPLRLIAFPGTLHIHEFPYMALKVPVKRFSGQDAATSLVKLQTLCQNVLLASMKMPTPVVSLLWQAGTHVCNFAEKGEVNFKNLRCGEKQNTKTKTKKNKTKQKKKKTEKVYFRMFKCCPQCIHLTSPSAASLNSTRLKTIFEFVRKTA